MDSTLQRRILVESARLASELVDFFEELDRDPPGLLARIFPIEDPMLRAPSSDPDTSTTVPRSPVTGAPVSEDVPFPAARRGLEKIMRAGLEAALLDDEVLDLQTVIMVAVRPAILIKDGHFLVPPPPWQILEASRDAIEAVARSVGRIQISPATEDAPFAGSGFFVAPDLVMTNRHVAETFGGIVDGSFVFAPAAASAVDLAREPDADGTPEFAVRSVSVHPTLDLALLRVEFGDMPAVPPLTVASEAPSGAAIEQPRLVYAIGYPGRDPAHDESVLEELLGGVFGVKRLQPGGIMRILDDTPHFNHDCSTLRGSSGSCVVDLTTHQVIGLHSAGKLRKFNEAVALWRLVDEPLLSGVNFG